MHKSGARFLVCASAVLLALGPPAAQARPQLGGYERDTTGGCVSLVPIAIREPLAGPFEPGCTEYQIKYGVGTASQGSYGALEFPACTQDSCGSYTGASRYRCELVYGYPCCLDDGTCIPALAGNLAGPTAQGLASRFDSDTDVREGICYAQYAGNGSRIVTAPITGALQGAWCYAVLRYGQFFLTRIPGSGGTAIIWATLIAWVDPNTPTPALRATWGEVKTLYR